MVYICFLKVFIFLVFINVAYQDRNNSDNHRPSCDCGLSIRQRRIIGGQPVPLYQSPWTVALGLRNGKKYILRCAGAILSSRYVLTAAHCAQHLSFLFGLIQFTLVVDIGDYDISTSTEMKSYIIGIETMIKHEDFVRKNLKNDIALLKLEESVSFSDINVKPVCLPPSKINLDDKVITVVGWGALDQKGHLSTTLREITIPTISNSKCQDLFHERRIQIFPTVLCAGILDGSKDACQADSGGPSTLECDGQQYLVGIISFGIKCATKNFPGVYTDISQYVYWIRNQTMDYPGCYPKCNF